MAKINNRIYFLAVNLHARGYRITHGDHPEYTAPVNYSKGKHTPSANVNKQYHPKELIFVIEVILSWTGEDMVAKVMEG